MNEQHMQDKKAIKSLAKLQAKHWMVNNFSNLYTPTNNKAVNDTHIQILKDFNDQFVLMIPNISLNQIYMFKYITKMIINIIDGHSDRVSYGSFPEKPKSCGM